MRTICQNFSSLTAVCWPLLQATTKFRTGIKELNNINLTFTLRFEVHKRFMSVVNYLENLLEWIVCVKKEKETNMILK